MATRLERHLCRPVERVHRAYRPAARLPPLCHNHPVYVRLAFLSLCRSEYHCAPVLDVREASKKSMLSPCEVPVSGDKPNHLRGRVR
jgi:hypothetical protein